MPKESHNPVRTCLGCMKRDFQSAMVRIAERDGAIVVDPDARIAGRGGYLHRRPACLEGFVKSKAKESRSLRRRIERPERIRIVETIKPGLASEPAVE
jgi:uncharacterized protein